MARVIIQHADTGEEEVQLHEGSLTVGRDDGSDVALDAAAVSPLHASLYEENARWYVKDEGSLYGTFVNDRRVTEQGLKHGDVIELGLGGPTLRFESGEHPVEEEPITLEEVVPDYGQPASSPSATAVRPALMDFGEPAAPGESEDDENTVELEGVSPSQERTTVELEGAPRSDEGTTVELEVPASSASGTRRVVYALGGLVLLAAAVLWLRACSTPLAGADLDAPDPPHAGDLGAPVTSPEPGTTTHPVPPPRPS